MRDINEQGSLRITTHGRDTVSIVNCANAGKRGKVCETITIRVYSEKYNSQAFLDLTHNLPMKLEDLKNYEQALQFVELAKNPTFKTGRFEVYFGSEKGVRVAPIGFETVQVGNANYNASASF